MEDKLQNLENEEESPETYNKLKELLDSKNISYTLLEVIK